MAEAGISRADAAPGPAESLLSPRSVAFVGISAKGGAGAKMLRSTLRFGFDGPIWPVNPRSDEIEGQRCHASLSDLPGVPDCVVIAVPAPAVLDVVEEAAALGIRGALVVSEGFADAGTDEGIERQARLVEIARSAGMAVAGPNCMGIATTAHRFAATMSDIPDTLPSGGISVVSQSGGLMNAVAELCSNRGIGLNYMLSIGNQAVLDLADYIDYLADDPETRVIACIMEGAKDGRRFRAAVERASRKKPLAILKLGRSEAGKAATLAHTGTLAGSDEAYEALFRRNGVASVLSLDELVETAALLATAPKPAGTGVCLLTVSGGATSLIGDLAERVGLHLPAISAETSRRVGEALGIERDFNNPLDTVGMPRLRQDGAIDGVVAALLDDPAVDVVGLVLGMRHEGAPAHDKLVGRMEAMAATAKKPLLVLSFISNSLTGRWRDHAVERRLNLLEDIECGLRAVGHLVDYAEYRRRPVETAAVPVLPQQVKGADTTLTEAASKRLLAAAGIPATLEFLATSPEEAAARAAEIGRPVAIKIQSPEIPHKSDIGGVHLGATADTAREAAAEVFANARRHCPDARIEGVLVQEMVPEGTEMILGMTYDPTFGPLVVLGAGGVTVEVFKDASVALPPVDRDEAAAMIDRLRASVMLKGFRGAPVRDREALVDCIVQFSKFVAGTDGQFGAIDLNPVFVHGQGQGVSVADALIYTRTEREDLHANLDEIT